MAKTLLADVTDGLAVHTLAYLKQKKLVPYKNKTGSFLTLTLADRSGTLEGKIFDNAEEIAPRLPDNRIVSIDGRGSAYQGTLGMIIDKVVVWDGPVDKADFLPAYPGDVAALEAQLDALIASITTPDLTRLLRGIFDDPDVRARYVEAPAAKAMHGAYLHGLLEHVVRQAQLAETACRCYPQANRDLVIAGVLLHDIGKIDEFSWELTIDYTTRGRLLGHIVIGDRLVFERGREQGIGEELALQLRHLILSHHGQRDMGAVTLPQTLEAVILHSVDNLEAKAAHCQDMLRTGDAASMWSDFDRIEERFWYRGALPAPETLF
ncbi:MAG: 3'-5' exoribonuclease YhaM family protein [Armatimonadota bacterium]